MKRLLICGPGRSGKDTAAVMLSEITKLPYAGSTSWAAKELVAAELGIHSMVAWDTRHQKRQEWRDICDLLRTPDQTRLIRRAFRSVHPDNLYSSATPGIVTGIRDRAELIAAREENLFDRIIFIERPGIPDDPTLSFTSEDCDEVLVNDGTLIKLHSTLFLWAERKGLIPALYLGRPPTIDRYRE